VSRPAKLKAAALLPPPERPPLALALADGEASFEKILADRQLVDRCLSREPAGWSELYHQFHDRLRSSIRAILGRLGSDASLVDEIAARVWYALVKNDFELLARFDVQRGCRLSTFFSVLAKNEARQLLRSERRRRAREQGAARTEPSSGYDAELEVANEEFLAMLTPAEYVFYRDVVLAIGESEGDASYSRANAWQLTHRVRKKLNKFLGSE
jgi:DNA-directed RNA polymerase specialized sigma24 family protein